MKQRPEKSYLQVTSKAVTSKRKKQFLEEYLTNQAAINKKIADFIFEQRGFFIRYASGEFDTLVNQEKRPNAKKKLIALKSLMDAFVAEIAPNCKEKEARLEIIIQETMQGGNVAQRLIRLEELYFDRFIYQLFYKKNPIAYENVRFSQNQHEALQKLLSDNKDFSFSIYVAFFAGEENISMLMRDYNNLSQQDLSKLKKLITHLGEHKDFYISSRDRSVFMGFLKAIRMQNFIENDVKSDDILKKMGEFSADLLVEFARIETADIHWSRRSFSENPYSCFHELLGLKKDSYERYMAHFFLLNPHIANYLSAQLEQMELFASLWVHYKNLNKVSNGKDMEIMVNSVIEHLFKNRDFYFWLASGYFDDLVEKHPDKLMELRNCVIDLMSDMSIEEKNIKPDANRTSEIYLFLRDALLHRKLYRAQGQLFTTAQAQLFKDFMYLHLRQIEILYQHVCHVPEEDEEDGLSELEALIMEARYLVIKNEETLEKLADHLNVNRKFYEVFFEELVLNCPSLRPFFKEASLFSEVLELFLAPETFDTENNGFESESPRNSLIRMLKIKDPKYDMSQNITDFFLCNPSLADFLCDNYEQFVSAVELYKKSSASVTHKRKSVDDNGRTDLGVQNLWKKQATSNKSSARKAINGFWKRNQPIIPVKQEEGEFFKTIVASDLVSLGNVATKTSN